MVGKRMALKGLKVLFPWIANKKYFIYYKGLKFKCIFGLELVHSHLYSKISKLNFEESLISVSMNTVCSYVPKSVIDNVFLTDKPGKLCP